MISAPLCKTLISMNLPFEIAARIGIETRFPRHANTFLDLALLALL